MTPSFRPFAVFTIVAFLLAGCGALPLLTREASFTTQEMTARLTKRFPVERNIADLVKVNLTRPRVSIVAPAAGSNTAARLGILVDLDVKLPLTNKSLFGEMMLTGVPRYDTATRAIFLQDAALERVRVENMPSALTGALTRTASQIAREYFEDKPIYTFDEKDLTRLGQTITPTRIDLRQNALVLVLK